MNLRNSDARLSRPEASIGPSRYRVMYRLLDSEDVRFLQNHGAMTAKFRRQRSRLFLRFLGALDREIEKSLRQRLLHEHWDMLQIAQEKFWVRGQVWRLRVTALAFALGVSANAYDVRQQLSSLIGRTDQPGLATIRY